VDRVIVSPNEQLQDTDVLKTNRNAMVALSKLSSMMLGNNTLLNGLACTATAPASTNIVVSPGEIYSLQPIDSTAYSSLPADTHQILKQGLLLDKVTLACPVPSTAGFAANHLIQVSFLENDTDGASRQFKDPDTGAIITLTKNQTRQGRCLVELKQGVAALNGTQVTPTPDAGKIGIYTVKVASGTTKIEQADIDEYPNAPFVTERLTDKISLATADARYAKIGSTTPHISFKANTTTVIPIPSGGPHKFALGNVISNHGNCYNPATGDFKAKFKGSYLFFLSIEYTNLSGASAGSLYDYLYLNGTEEIAIGDLYYDTPNPNSGNIIASTLIDLNIGDTISTYANYTGFTTGGIRQWNETYFYGYLIAPLP